MNPNRFDALARMLAARLPRRRALLHGVAALTAGASFVTVERRANAQATPSAAEDEAVSAPTSLSRRSGPARSPRILMRPGSIPSVSKGVWGRRSTSPTGRLAAFGLVSTAILLEKLGFTKRLRRMPRRTDHPGRGHSPRPLGRPARRRRGSRPTMSAFWPTTPAADWLIWRLGRTMTSSHPPSPSPTSSSTAVAKASAGMGTSRCVSVASASRKASRGARA